MQLQTQKILRTDIICIINGEEGRGSHQLGRGEGEKGKGKGVFINGKEGEGGIIKRKIQLNRKKRNRNVTLFFNNNKGEENAFVKKMHDIFIGRNIKN